VATLVAAVVGVAGLAGTALLFNEGAPLRAIAAASLTALFVFLITLLVPRLSVTLFAEGAPALVLAQTSSFPSTRIVVRTPSGETAGELVRSAVNRFWRERWTIHRDGFLIGEAWEAPLSAALTRKLLGKFSRKFECDVTLAHGGIEVGRIRRRPDANGEADVLELTNDLADARLGVALATVILGSEP
jgi:hypothetical protein